MGPRQTTASPLDRVEAVRLTPAQFAAYSRLRALYVAAHYALAYARHHRDPRCGSLGWADLSFRDTGASW